MAEDTFGMSVRQTMCNSPRYRETTHNNCLPCFLAAFIIIVKLLVADDIVSDPPPQRFMHMQ